MKIGAEMKNKKTLLDFSKLTGKSFQDLCYSILLLLNPTKIEQYWGGPDRGRDIEMAFLTTDSKMLPNDGIEQWWWVECKQKTKGNIGIGTISKNIVHALRKHPPPPHILMYMTTAEFTNESKQAFIELQELLPFNIDCLDWIDIQKIVLNHPQILKNYFPGFDENLLSTLNISKPKTKNIFVEASRGLDYSNPILKLQKDRQVEITINLNNLSLSDWKNIPLHLKLPKGLLQVEGNIPVVDLKPFTKKTIKVTIEVKKDTKKISELPQIIISGQDDDYEIDYSFSKSDYTPTIYFPFVGRQKESNYIINSIEENPSLILVEGLPGEGKTRLINESSFVLSKKGYSVLEIGKDSLISSNSLLKKFAVCLLGISQSTINHKLAKHLLKYQFRDIIKDSNEKFINFILGEYGTTKETLNRFTGILKSYINRYLNQKIVIKIDDLHHMSASVSEMLILILQTFLENISFIIGYRENEIQCSIRSKLLNISSPPVKLHEMPDTETIKILNSVTSFSNDVKLHLTTLSGGNLYCLIEILRLLKESGNVRFNADGKLEETHKDSYNQFELIDRNLQNDIVKYARNVALRRYKLFIKNKDSEKNLIEQIVMFLATMSESVPISFLQSVFGYDILSLLDDLIDEQILTFRGQFTNELGIFLIHDRMSEALSEFGASRKIFWANLNRQVAESLEKYLDRTHVHEYFKKISEHFGIAGNISNEFNYLEKHFDLCVKYQQNSEVIVSGKKCLKLIDSLREIKGPLAYSDEKSKILLRMGISFHNQRTWNEMENLFQQYELTTRLNLASKHILKVYRLTAAIRAEPYETVDKFLEIEKSISILECIENPSEDVQIALVHALNRSFNFLKMFHGDYKRALELNKKSIKLCRKYNFNDRYIMELIDRGTLILFTDEEYRNTLNFSKMPRYWHDALEHWNKVLEKAEEEKIIETLIETNCAVGFMKMYLGAHEMNHDYFEDSFTHFMQAQELAQKFSHPFWQNKLHNHIGIHHALNQKFEDSKSEFEKGLILAKKIKNKYTTWMIYQNLANISMHNNRIEYAIKYWKSGFETAIDGYFKYEELAVKNYNFRLFLRGFFLHQKSCTALIGLTSEFCRLFKLIQKDLGLENFKKFIQSHNLGELESKDMYVYQKSYYNTH